MEPLRARFNLPSIQHARVFWEYCKYMVDEFAVHTTGFQGTKAIAGMGSFSS